MAALSSSSLLSPRPIVLSDHKINTVINAVNMYVGHINMYGNANIFQNRMLLPCLNQTRIEIEYEAIIVQPNLTVNFVSSTQSSRTYFCKANDQVYEVITDSDDNVVSVKTVHSMFA